MKHAMIVSGMLFALASVGAVAQDEKKPAVGAATQGAAQGQADVKADGSGATATGKAAGAAGAQAGESSAAVAEGTEISATLTKPVDAGKSQPGDEVTARASKDVRSGGAVVVPRGSTLIGRVTQARPRKSGSGEGSASSQLGIVFDRAVRKDGSSVPLNGSVAALGAARAAGAAGSAASGAGASGMGGSAGTSGGLAGTVGGTVGGVAGTTAGAAGGVSSAIGGTAAPAGNSAGAVGGFDATGGLRSGSRGVFGARDIDLSTAAAGSGEGSVITSATRNVRLESGTQMLILAGGSVRKGPAAPAKEPAKEPVDRR